MAKSGKIGVGSRVSEAVRSKRTHKRDSNFKRDLNRLDPDMIDDLMETHNDEVIYCCG